MQRWSILVLAILSSCSTRPDRTRTVDLNAAAARAESDIANYSASGAPPIVHAEFTCDDGTRIGVRFDNRASTAGVTIDGAVPVLLVERRVASGIAYDGAGYALRGKGRRMTLTTPRGRTWSCTERPDRPSTSGS